MGSWAVLVVPEVWGSLGTVTPSPLTPPHPIFPADDDPIPLLPVLLGVLLPVFALLGLAGLYILHHHHTKIGEYWLWRRQPVVEMRPCGHRAAPRPQPPPVDPL